MAPRDLFGPELVVPQSEYEGQADRSAVEGMPPSLVSPRILVLRNERAILELNRQLTTLGLSQFKQRSRGEVVRSMLSHFVTMWRRPSACWSHWGLIIPNSVERVWYGSYAVFMAMFALGVLAARRRGMMTAVPLSWLILMAGHVGLFLLILGSPRYQVTSAIFIYIFSGLGVATCLAYLTRKRPPAVASSWEGHDGLPS